MIATAIYALCALTSLTTAAMLYRHSRGRQSPMLFWSFVGFLGLCVSNVLVFADLVVFPTVDMVLPRTIIGTVAMMALLYGLIRSTGP
jgi:hypothetical protein